MADWIDQERTRRLEGIKRPLSQSQHAAVNARYPGTTLQHCDECGEPTGRCEEDAIYVEQRGPLCESCASASEPVASTASTPDGEQGV